MQPPGRSRSRAAPGVAGAPDARSAARASSACVLTSSAAAQPARHLQLRSCTSGLATTTVMFVQMPQQVRQPADSHMQERTNWRKSARDWVLLYKVQLRSQYNTSSCKAAQVGLQQHSV